MKVALALPEGFAPVPGRAEARSGMTSLHWSALELAPADESAYLLGVLGGFCPADCGVVRGPAERVTTVDGWHVLLVPAWLRRGDGTNQGALLAAFYRFGAHIGYAIAESVGAEALAALRPTLLGARPDFTGPLLGPGDFIPAMEP